MIKLGSDIPGSRKDVADSILEGLKEEVFGHWAEGFILGITAELDESGDDEATWIFCIDYDYKKETGRNPDGSFCYLDSSSFDEAHAFINGVWWALFQARLDKEK